MGTEGLERGWEQKGMGNMVGTEGLGRIYGDRRAGKRLAGGTGDRRIGWRGVGLRTEELGRDWGKGMRDWGQKDWGGTGEGDWGTRDRMVGERC